MSKRLFVHGWATDGGLWDSIATALETDGSGALSPNLPGHGSPARWLEPSLNPALLSMARLLSDEEDGLIGIGWSLGAQVLLSLALRFPEKFSALVLVGATPCFVERADFVPAQSRALVRRMIMDMKRDPAETLTRFYGLNFTEEEQGSTAVSSFLERYAPPGPIVCEAGLKGGPTACRQAFNYRDITTGLEALYNTDIRSRLKEINIPTLIVHGEADAVVPLGAGEFVAENIKGARLKVFSRAGHAPFITQEARFIEVVKEFLDGYRAVVKSPSHLGQTKKNVNPSFYKIQGH